MQNKGLAWELRAVGHDVGLRADEVGSGNRSRARKGLHDVGGNSDIRGSAIEDETQRHFSVYLGGYQNTAICLLDLDRIDSSDLGLRRRRGLSGGCFGWRRLRGRSERRGVSPRQRNRRDLVRRIVAVALFGLELVFDGRA